MGLQSELAALDAPDDFRLYDIRRYERELRRRVEDWRGLVQRETPIARQLLDGLLEERIAWTPHASEGFYGYTGRLKFDRLLSGSVVTEGSTSPTRFAKVVDRRIGGRLRRATAQRAGRESRQLSWQTAWPWRSYSVSDADPDRGHSRRLS